MKGTSGEIAPFSTERAESLFSSSKRRTPVEREDADEFLDLARHVSRNPRNDDAEHLGRSETFGVESTR